MAIVRSISSKCLFIVLIPYLITQAQYYEGTPRYEQKQQTSESLLQKQIKIDKGHQYTATQQKSPEFKRHKERFRNVLGYRISIPGHHEYTISLLVNPCGFNSSHSHSIMNDIYHLRPITLGYDCCMHVYGRGEYGHLTKEAIQQQNPYPYYRIGKSDLPVLAQPHEVLHNIHIVDEDGTPIPYSQSRRADDYTEIDERCVDIRNPFPSCLQYRLKAIKSPLMAPCMDYNQTVDTSLHCFTPQGQRQPYCMQVGFGQTAFIHVCGGEFANDNHCGTFLEIHLPNGSYYDDENTVLSETKLTTSVTNGIVTTTLSLLYKNNPNRILCDIRETTIRLGTMVIINDQAIKCCCPPVYQKGNKLGSFFCPKKPRTRYDGGPFADAVDTTFEWIERDKYVRNYPYCPVMKDHQDALLCSKQSNVFMEDRYDEKTKRIKTQGRFYTYPCNEVVKDEERQIFSSSDLDGEYNTKKCSQGETFKACAELPNSNSNCYGKDFLFSFAGEIGKVVSLPSDYSGQTELQQYGVTFNDGRSTYFFYRHQIELLYQDNYNRNSYEIWFVQRTRMERIILKKKSFRVVHPRCTYDTTNGIYFPFAQLDDDGNWMETFSEYDGIQEETDYVLDSMESFK